MASPLGEYISNTFKKGTSSWNPLSSQNPLNIKAEQKLSKLTEDPIARLRRSHERIISAMYKPIAQTGKLIQQYTPERVNMPTPEAPKPVNNFFIDELLKNQHAKMELGSKITGGVSGFAFRDIKDKGKALETLGEQKQLSGWNLLDLYDMATPGIPEGAMAKGGLASAAPLVGGFFAGPKSVGWEDFAKIRKKLPPWAREEQIVRGLKEMIPRVSVSDEAMQLKFGSKSSPIHKDYSNLIEDLTTSFTRKGEKQFGPIDFSDFISHPKLFEQYPHLKDLPVSFMGENPSRLGVYNPMENSMEINPSVYKYWPEKMRGNVMHEAQHGIQEFENIAGGGNPQAATMYIDTYIDRLFEAAREAKGKVKDAEGLGRPFEIMQAQTYEKQLKDLAGYLGIIKKSSSPQGVYNMIAGEQEADLVEKALSAVKYVLPQYEKGNAFQVMPPIENLRQIVLGRILGGVR